jgi:hypothetical protein
MPNGLDNKLVCCRFNNYLVKPKKLNCVSCKFNLVLFSKYYTIIELSYIIHTFPIMNNTPFAPLIFNSGTN